MNKTQHIIPHNGKWAIKVEGCSDVVSIHNTQMDAITTAIPIATNHKSKVVIHCHHEQTNDKDKDDGTYNSNTSENENFYFYY